MIKRITDTVKENYLIILSIACFLFMVLPYVIVAAYAGPSADDYSNLYVTLLQDDSTFFGKAIHASVNIYKRWQGTYSGNIFTYVGGAIYHYGGMDALQWEYVFNVLLFFASGLFLFWRLFARVTSSLYKRCAIALFTASLFDLMVLYDLDVSEVFYWHTGLSMYTLPTCCAVLTIGILVKENVSGTEVALAAVMAVFAAGGALDIAAFVTGSTLLVILYKSYFSRRIDKRVVCFIAALAGSIANAIAPGNYIRHASFSESFPIAGALRLGFVSSFKAIWAYVGNGTIILVFCLCLLLFNIMKESGIRFVNPAVMCVLFFCGSVIIDFPVYLGYASESFPPRCLFVRKVSMVLFLVIAALNLTGWIGRRVHEELRCGKEFVTIVIGLLLVSSVSIFPQGCWDDIKPFKIWNDICFIEDTLAVFESTNDYIIETLEAGVDQDVVIDVPDYDTLGYLKPIGITSDPEDWVNASVQSYFHNKSIVFTIGGN